MIKIERDVDMKDHISLRFCPDYEVGRKRKRILMIKAQYYTRLCHLKSLGQKQLSMSKLDTWLNKNIDKFYADERLRQKVANMKIDHHDLSSLMNVKNSDYQKVRMK